VPGVRSARDDASEVHARRLGVDDAVGAGGLRCEALLGADDIVASVAGQRRIRRHDGGAVRRENARACGAEPFDAEGEGRTDADVGILRSRLRNAARHHDLHDLRGVTTLVRGLVRGARLRTSTPKHHADEAEQGKASRHDEDITRRTAWC